MQKTKNSLQATIFYNIWVMQRQKKTDLAISQLGIQVNVQDQNDKYELSDLLCQILSYPTWQEAEVHRKANHLGNFDLLSEQTRLLQLLNSKNTNELQLCSCCGNIVNQKEIAFTTQLPQIKLGIGVRLYFTTLIHYTIIFLVTFVLYSLYTMITNINASKEQIQNICGHSRECSTANIGTGAKLASYEDFKNELAVQSVLGFMCVLVWAAILVKNYHNDRSLQKQLKQDWLSASDFTLMLSNYPASLLNPKKQQETLKNLKRQFKQYQNIVKSRISFEVVKVSIGYPLFGWAQQHKKQMQESQEEIKTKRALFKSMIKQRQSSPHFQLHEDKRNKQYEEFYQLITNHEYEKSNCLPELQEKNIIFVTLRYSRARDFILSINKQEKKCLFFKEQNKKQGFPVEGVLIEKAPQPDEIKWENIGFPKSLTLFRKVLIYVLAMLLIGLTLAISIFLGSFQADKPILISILISIVITVINMLIEFIIILVSYFQRQFQKSKEQVSIGIKIAVSQIINCIGVPITLVFLDKQSIYSSGGLVTNVFFIGLINMLLPFGRFIDPFNILLLLRERYYLSAQKRLNELQGQTELNKICSFYEFELGYEYSYIIKTAYFTGFYLTLQPIIALFAPIGLICMFYCNKYRLLYRFNKPNFHSSSVNSKLAFILKCSVVALAVGQLYFMNFQSYTAHFQLVINWVSFSLSVIFVFCPLSCCGSSTEQSFGGLDYQQQMLYLTTDYDRLNPVTREKAIAHFQQFLQQYQKKCNLPLPERSEIIRRSMIQVSKHAPVSIINFMRQKTRIKEAIASELHTMDRLRSS